MENAGPTVAGKLLENEQGCFLSGHKIGRLNTKRQNLHVLSVPVNVT